MIDTLAAVPLGESTQTFNPKKHKEVKETNCIFGQKKETGGVSSRVTIKMAFLVVFYRITYDDTKL